MTLYNGYKIISLVIWIVLLYTEETVAASTWPSTFVSTTWLDNTRGTLSFTNSTLSGLTMTLFGVTHNTWDCVDNSSSSLLIMKSQSTISITVSGFVFKFSVYLCLDLVQITSVSYYYYQRHEAQPTFGYERVYVSSSSNVTSASVICNFTISIPTAEFHVMVKSGNASGAKVTCPSGILGTYDYVYYPKDNSSALCNSSRDLWDGCTDKTMITFNYTTCTQKIAYSAGGVVWCVANIGDTYGVVYNNDSSLVSSNNDKLATYRFSCIVGNHASASIAPGNCTSQQTATSYPVKWNSVSLVNENIGVYLSISPYVTCGSTQSSVTSTVNVGAIVGGVLGAIIICVIGAILVYYFVIVRRGKVHKMPIEKVAEEPTVIDATVQAPVNPETTMAPTGKNKSPRSKESKKSDNINDNSEKNKAKTEKETTLVIVKETNNKLKQKKKGKGKGKAKGKKNAAKSEKDDKQDEQDMESMTTGEPTQIDNANDKELEDTNKTVVLYENIGIVEKGDHDKKEGSKNDTLVINGRVKESTLIKNEPVRNGTIINGHVKEPTLIKEEPVRNGTIINGHVKEPTLINDVPVRNGTVLSLADVEADASSVLPDIVPAKKKGKGKGKQKTVIEVKEAESKQDGETGEKKGKKKKSKKGKGKKK
ncbi:hypothetical protein CHS0354_025209 [Potamilus streckersoni]|uniref:Ig-like domain-containing protein n=1 Tax=Potamilus streckersoni TaxID=2493646 RepID=A0AAE0RMZ3_9BIVA|nr:hypothetical protein CHS0354_025209 [Potamilus streckersoni]